ncbi:hypothetical protein Bbelb_110710 [Branchiostoma belcheri]|nr:hypothetical protein Bbelb_110710 [Branchiostoma belcheri]
MATRNGYVDKETQTTATQTDEQTSTSTRENIADGEQVGEDHSCDIAVCPGLLLHTDAFDWKDIYQSAEVSDVTSDIDGLLLCGEANKHSPGLFQNSDLLRIPTTTYLSPRNCMSHNTLYTS